MFRHFYRYTLLGYVFEPASLGYINAPARAILYFVYAWATITERSPEIKMQLGGLLNCPRQLKH